MIAMLASAESGAFESRDIRAATEDITLEKEAEGMYRANSEYMLDIIQGVCWCPDHEYHNAHCKHLRKAEMIEDERDIPNVLELDEDLRQKIIGPPEPSEAHEALEDTETTEKVPLTDGGVTSARSPTPSEDLPETEVEIDIRDIVGEQTTTIEDLPDFSHDEPAGWHGEPYSSIVTFAYESVTRVIETETNAESTTE